MVDADGATKISDVERLEETLSRLAKDHVSSLVFTCVPLSIFTDFTAIVLTPNLAHIYSFVKNVPIYKQTELEN